VADEFETAWLIVACRAASEDSIDCPFDGGGQGAAADAIDVATGVVDPCGAL
jgi:hypothetical protein